MEEYSEEQKKLIRRKYEKHINFLKDALYRAQVEESEIGFGIKLGERDEDLFENMKKIKQNALDRINLYKQAITNCRRMLENYE